MPVGRLFCAGDPARSPQIVTSVTFTASELLQPKFGKGPCKDVVWWALRVVQAELQLGPGALVTLFTSSYLQNVRHRAQHDFWCKKSKMGILRCLGNILCILFSYRNSHWTAICLSRLVRDVQTPPLRCFWIFHSHTVSLHRMILGRDVCLMYMYIY